MVFMLFILVYYTFIKLIIFFLNITVTACKCAIFVISATFATIILLNSQELKINKIEFIKNKNTKKYICKQLTHITKQLNFNIPRLRFRVFSTFSKASNVSLCKRRKFLIKYKW